MKNNKLIFHLNIWQKLLKFKYYFLSFFILGIFVYFPVMFNGFVWDDTGYIIDNPQIQQFGFSTFIENIYNSDYIYRQIPALYYALLYSLFGQNPFPYHLFELLLHILATSLIFIFLKNFLSTKLSFLLCIIFLVHPINAETVNWISSAQTQIYTIFGLLSLLIVQKKNLTNTHVRLLALCLFLCIMSYEIGILYLLLVPLCLYINKSTRIKKIIILELFVFAFYIFLRIMGNSLNIHAYQKLIDTPTFAEIIWTIPSIISYYIKTLIYPNHLIIWQYWTIKQASLVTFILPAITIQMSIILFIVLCNYLKKDKRKNFIFFTIWFVMGMIPLLQIIPLLMTVADRWFYFPFIGLLGMIGIIASNYQYKVKKYKIFLLILFTIIIGVYSLRSFYRSFDWKDNITLFTHDLQYEPDHIHLNNNLAILYFQSENYTKAIPYLEKLASLPSNHKNAYIYLGLIYTKQGNNKKASVYFQKALSEPSVQRISNGVDTYFLLAQAYQNGHEYAKIINVLTDDIISTSSQKDDLLFIRADAYYQMRNFEKAHADMNHINSQIYDPKVIELGKKINEAL